MVGSWSDCKKLLDDPSTYQQLDRSNMLSHIENLPEQCLEAWQKALEFTLPDKYRGVRRVVVCGMGGSAIGGDLLAGLSFLERREVVVYREYSFPPQDERTLIIFCSYSGNTEETISALRGYLKGRGKKLVVAGGGKLAQLAQENNLPLFPITYKAPPRACLGYTFIGLLALTQRLELIGDKTAEFEEMTKVLRGQRERFGVKVPSEENLAKKIALELKGKMAIIYGAGFLGNVARRWKTQINENSKSGAFFELLPELNHNSVVGYRLPFSLVPHQFVILLSSPLLPERISQRIILTSQLLSEAGINHRIVEGEGDSALSQLMSLLFLGDWTSYYLAMLNQVDPTPVPQIDFLKTRLAQFPWE